ncbi:MAG: hypothetical protein IJ218_01095 [Alphaproteobacteria bacterium]|nr:hypothetical protein [Alphaproteobacteria bacterium]
MIADSENDNLQQDGKDNLYKSATDTSSGKRKSKKGFDDSERLTLRIDALEAEKYQAKKTKQSTNNLPKNMRKIKTKVRQLEEDDEEDEDLMDHDAIRSLRQLQINQNDASNADSSLINALFDNERRQIMQNTNIEISRHQENAGRQNALEQADTMLRKADMKRMNTKEFMEEMKEAIYNPSKLRREALQDQIAKQMGIEGKIEKRSEGVVLEGIKKVKELSNNKQVPQLKMNDVEKIGTQKMNQNETAELILKKSGQTSRLEEIKRDTGIKKTTAKSTDDKEKSHQKSGKKSYSAQMKELLKESLKKNNKTR